MVYMSAIKQGPAERGGCAFVLAAATMSYGLSAKRQVIGLAPRESYRYPRHKIPE